MCSLVLLASCAAKNHPNFTGTWQLDPKQSNFGPVPGPTQLVQIIEHHEPVLRMKSESIGFMGETSSDVEFVTDGSEKTQTIDGKPRQSRTHWEGNVLVTQWTIANPGQPAMQMTDRRLLSEDGRTMVVDRQVHSDYDDWTQKAVFVRKTA